MALKGHTKIELTNTETGEVRTVEDDNMVTNALGMFVENTGCLNYNVFSMSDIVELSTPFLVLSRGLMLFSDPIDEDPSIIYPPSGNLMTGQAGAITYSGNQTTIGSYNVNESGEVENGYRYVWDFNNSQANGRINCACLTSQNGGLMGAGSDISPDDGTVTAMNIFYPYDFRHSNYLSYDRVNRICASNMQYVLGLVACIYVDFENNCFYSFGELPYLNKYEKNYAMLKNKRIVINKCRLPVNNYSLFDVKMQEKTKVIETITFDLPEEFVDEYSSYFNRFTGTSLNYVLGCMNEYKKHLYVYLHTQAYSNITTGALPAGARFLVLDLDIENKTISYFAVTNTTGQTLTLPINNSNDVYITDKYILMRADNGRLYKISRENNADVVMIKYPNGKEQDMGTHDVGGYFWVEVEGKLYGTRCNVANNHHVVYCIDPELNTVQHMAVDSRTFPGLCQISTNNWTTKIWTPIARVYGTKYGPLYVTVPFNGTNSDTGNHCMYPFIFPNYLLTINNLPQEITKTSAETMKVTYTITDIANYNK